MTEQSGDKQGHTPWGDPQWITKQSSGTKAQLFPPNMGFL